MVEWGYKFKYFGFSRLCFDLMIGNKLYRVKIIQYFMVFYKYDNFIMYCLNLDIFVLINVKLNGMCGLVLI